MLRIRFPKEHDLEFVYGAREIIKENATYNSTEYAWEISTEELSKLTQDHREYVMANVL